MCGASPGSKMRMYGEVPHPPLRSTAICPQNLCTGAKATPSCRLGRGVTRNDPWRFSCRDVIFFASDDSAISDHLEQAALEEEVERLALDDESSDDGLGGSNEDDSE